jgi:hypothetical protein
MSRMNSIANLAIVSAALIASACAQTPAAATPAAPAPKAAVSAEAADNPLHVSVTSLRPLERAIESLHVKYGWVVSYEDPQYLHDKDVTPDARSKGILIPAGGSFSVDLPPAKSPTDAPAEDKSLQVVVDAYNHSGNPGEFELRKGSAEADAFAVVGVAARDKNGAVSPQKPFLDSIITVPVAERTISETVNLVCKALTRETHVSVSTGVTPRSLVDNKSVKVGGAKVPARTILAQALAGSGHTMYWRLLFDPTSKGYLLNIHAVNPHAVSPAKAPAHEMPGKPPASDVHPTIPKP